MTLGGVVNIDSKILHNITRVSVSKYLDQPSRIYWNDGKQKEVTFEEKRIIAIIEAVSMELDLGLEVDYDTKK